MRAKAGAGSPGRMRPFRWLVGAALLLGPMGAGVPPAVAQSADTAAVRPPAMAESFEGVTPRGAFLRSLVLPGWGQSVTGSPERGAVYFALEATSLWMVYKSRRKLDFARDREAILRETGQLRVEESFGLVSARRQQVEDWTTLSVFWLFLSAADAFVSAHLADFEERIGGDRVRVSRTPDGALRLQARLPLGASR